MILRVDHTQITIPKGAEAEARDFYCGLLGLCEIDKPEALRGRGGFWLSVGNHQVHIGTEDDVDRMKTKAHVAYEVNALEDLRKLFEKRGIEIHNGIQIPGYTRFEIRDPFGNRLEFLQRDEHQNILSEQ
ncbi:MAG TPA: VOC family protein [Pyrinomonadaceae bacterium]|nr:VOC family protein [Pyrinomonadaceae bacterium]